jgi:hypothetical protein
VGRGRGRQRHLRRLFAQPGEAHRHGHVAAALARPGTQLIIDVRGRKIAATVTPMPFVPHRYHRKGAA